MAIETVGSFQKILENYNSKDWAKSIQNVDTSIDEFSNKATGLAPTQSFSELLNKSMEQVNQLQNDANTAIQRLTTGESKNLHETMLLVEEADIAFRQMNQIRMKVIDAYKEIMKMQV